MRFPAAVSCGQQQTQKRTRSRSGTPATCWGAGSVGRGGGRWVTSAKGQLVLLANLGLGEPTLSVWGDCPGNRGGLGSR